MRRILAVLVEAAGLALAFALLVFAMPASGHHKPGHSKGNGVTTTLPPTTTTTTTTPPGGLPPGVTLRQIDGGPNYYGRFSNSASMDNPAYFPIGVWGSYAHEPENRNLDASIGINTYLWVADNQYMDDIRADGRFKVIQDHGNQANSGSETVGWLLGDEQDMSGATCPSALDAAKATLPADGKFRYGQYGKGVALPPHNPGDPGSNGNWWSDAVEQNCWVNGVDVASNDLYWFTDPHQGVYCCGWRYGDNITHLRNADASDGQRHPNWAFVETGHPWSESFSPTITPPQIRSAAWHSIINGARGLLYFQHSFGGPCVEHHGLRSNCTGNTPAVTTLNGQIKQLAPVLNSPFADGFVTTTGGVRTMVKQGPDGAFYLFAGATTGGSVTFTVKAGSSAEVLFEGRSIPVVNGQFTDSFADHNAVHIYRLPLP